MSDFIQRPLYYICHRDALPAIAAMRALPCAEDSLDVPNIWSPEFSASRRIKPVPLASNAVLSRFVSFNATLATPALYNVATGKGVTRVRNDALIVFVTTAARLLDSLLPFVVSSVLPTSPSARFTAGPGGLDTLDWAALGRRDFRNDANDPDRGKRMGAEILVPGAVPLAAIAEVAVYVREDEVIEAFANIPSAPPVVRRPGSFFAQGA